MSMDDARYDVLIIGGGPAGATAGLVLARAGLRVAILEAEPFPRFHIGESLLPRNFALFRELGILDRLRKLPHVPKFGAEFGFGDLRPTTRFIFGRWPFGSVGETFNIERAPFDAELLAAAREAGARVFAPLRVDAIPTLRDGEVAVRAGGRTFAASWLIDASGQGTVVGRHLRTRRVLPDLKKVAYYAHYENVKRLEGIEAGHPTIVMCREGWFWIIPLNETKTSVGLVMEADAARGAGVPAERMLAWGIARCPLVWERCRDASGPETNVVTADFSYTCRPYAGPGYFLVGDAATFVDPVFSTGVCLGMMSAVRAAEHILAVGAGRRSIRAARRDYIRYVEGSSAAFFKVVRYYYRHPFRELFVHGYGPLRVHQALLAILAGNVFPRPAFSLRWRFRFFQVVMAIQRWVPLVPRQPEVSLFDGSADASTLAAESVVSARAVAGGKV